MKISLCLIFKGDSELEQTQRAVASIREYVEDIYLTANGPHERSKKWAKKEGINLSYLKWDDDFAKQRNFNFSQVPSDTDYILWMDSDDIIVGGDSLREIAQRAKDGGFDTVFFTYWYGCQFTGEPSYENLKHVDLTQTRERLIKPGSYVWKSRLHETPVPVTNLEPKYTKVDYGKKYPIVWLHLGAERYLSQEDQQKRNERNKRLLELQLEDERKAGQADPRTLLYLMKIYSMSDDEKELKEVIKMGDEYLTKSGWDAERGVCLSLMSKSYGELGDSANAKIAIQQAIQEYPYNPLFYLYLSRVCYNLGEYREMEHWLNMALQIEIDESSGQMNNLYEIKQLSAELTMKYQYKVKKNVRKAYEASKKLYELDPRTEYMETMNNLGDLADMDKASENIHKLLQYLEDIGEFKLIPELLDKLPDEFKKLPFITYYINKHSTPKVWKDNEICYYATMGDSHVERWNPDSLKTGIGGSETAVIQLSKQWTSKGYKVTVYADCGDEKEYDGVTWKPYWKFNPRDKFSTIILWRNARLAKNISAKKVLVDLHDLYNEEQYRPVLEYVDKFMVKSKYHRGLASFPDEKFNIISNGI